MVYRHVKQIFEHRNTKRSSARYIINEGLKTFNDAVYPRIPFLIRAKPYRMKIREEYGNNPSGQLKSQAYAVTNLVREERLALSYNLATEIRPQVERLIVEAMRNGDRHRPTMALANFWLQDKSLIHKLFKELVPRYQNYPSSFTAIHLLGRDFDFYKRTMTEIKESGNKARESKRSQAIIELRGNDLPPIMRPKLNKSELLTNVLLAAAREQSFNKDNKKEEQG